MQHHPAGRSLPYIRILWGRTLGPAQVIGLANRPTGTKILYAFTLFAVLSDQRELRGRCPGRGGLPAALLRATNRPVVLEETPVRGAFGSPPCYRSRTNYCCSASPDRTDLTYQQLRWLVRSVR